MNQFYMARVAFEGEWLVAHPVGTTLEWFKVEGIACPFHRSELNGLKLAK